MTDSTQPVIRDYIPLEDRLIVLRTPTPETTEEGIYIPTASRERSSEGTIVRISYDLDDKPISVGDTVLFSTYAGTPLPAPKDHDLLMLKYSDLIAVIPNQEPPHAPKS